MLGRGKYRRATEKDIPAITKLVSNNLEINVKDKSLGFIQTPYNVRQLIDTRVLVEADKILVTAIVHDITEEDENDYNVRLSRTGKYVYSVCTAGEYRKQGLGREFYKQLQNEFTGSNLYVAILLEPQPNRVSLGFHEVLGFKLIGKCPWKGHVYGLFELVQ